MKHVELVHEISRMENVSTRSVTLALGGLRCVLGRELKRGCSVEIAGLGAFSLRDGKIVFDAHSGMTDVEEQQR